MSTLKVGSIRHNNATSDAITTHSDGTVSASLIDVGGGQLSHRNMIINGAMTIAQRGTSQTNVTSNGYYVCDRWKFDLNGATVSIEQSSDNPGRGFTHSYKFTVTTPTGSLSAGNALKLLYQVEGYDIAKLGYGDSNAKSFTLSFWVKSSLTGVLAISFVRDSRIVNRQVTVSSANTWEYKTVTIAGDTSTAFGNTTNGTGMRINIFPSAGGNATGGASIPTWNSFHNAHTAYGANMGHLTTNNSTFQITGVQMELGDTATTFEHKSRQDEFLRCYRYYNKKNPQYGRIGHMYTNDRIVFSLDLPCEMRTTPTVSNSGGLYFARYNGLALGLSGIQSSAYDTTSQRINLTVTSNGSAGNTAFIWSGSTYYILDAEL